jgi:ribosome maturation factor RimP
MDLPEHIAKEIEAIVSAEGLELVHTEYRPQGRGYVLRIDIDKGGGVTVEDCELVSRQVSTMLDAEDFGSARYTLEVSSPGLDRRFYKVSDYEKFMNHLVRIQTTEAVRGLHVIVGRLASFDGKTIVVNDEAQKKNPVYEIELANVKEARLEIEI